jgi:ATP-dependent DNA helicase RecG
VQALVTAEIEGEVSNSRMREVCDEHPADLTRILQGLVAKGFLDQLGQKRGASYQLLPPPGLHGKGDSSPSLFDSSHKHADSSHSSGATALEADPVLLAMAKPARETSRLSPGDTERIIIKLCDGRFLTAKEIARLLNRSPASVRSRFLSPLVQKRRLSLRFPKEPNRPDQAYTKNKKGKT